MKIVMNLTIYVYVLLYFLLFDMVRPNLIHSGRALLWWFVLFLYLLPGYLLIVWGILKKKGRALLRLQLVILILLTLTVILGDPMVKDHLRPYGLAQLWVCTAVAGFIWLFYGNRIIRKTDHPNESDLHSLS